MLPVHNSSRQRSSRSGLRNETEGNQERLLPQENSHVKEIVDQRPNTRDYSKAQNKIQGRLLASRISFSFFNGFLQTLAGGTVQTS